MKQTNNAIKFLMAQYRAIFKNANIAMVAAMAAAALAAGQASAAPNDATLDLGNNAKNPVASDTINQDVSLSGSTGGFINDLTIVNSGTLTFDGSTTANTGHIKVSNDLNVEAGGKLVLKGQTSSSNGTGVIGTFGDRDDFSKANSSLNVNGGTVEVTKSQIQMTNVNLTDATVTISTNINDKPNSDFDDNAQINAVVSDAGGGVFTVAGNKSKVTLNSGSILNAAVYNLNDGAIKLNGNANSGEYAIVRAYGKSIINVAGADISASTSGNYIGGKEINVTSGSINVENGGVLHLTGKLDTSKNIDAAQAETTVNVIGGKVNVAKGGTLTVKGQATFASGTVANAGTIEAVDGSTVNVGTVAGLYGDSNGGQLKLTGATLNFTGESLDLTEANVSGNGTSALTAENAAVTVKEGFGSKVASITASSVTASNTTGTFAVKSGESITVRNGLTVTPKDGKADLSVGGTLNLDGAAGNIAANVELAQDQSSTPALNVKSGNWNMQSLKLTSGAATVSGENTKVTFAQTSTLETTTNGKLKIQDNALVDASAGIIKFGASDTVLLTGGSTLVLDGNDVFKIENGNVSLVTAAGDVKSTFTKSAVNTDSTSVLQLKYTGNLSLANIDGIKTAIADTDKLNGFIKFEGANITDKPTGDVAIDAVKPGVDGIYNDVAVTVGKGGAVNQTFTAGQIKLTDAADSKAAVADGKTVMLTGSKGDFVVKSGGEAADASLGSGSSLVLAGDGAIGAITASSSTAGQKGTLSIGHSSLGYGTVNAKSIDGATAGLDVAVYGSTLNVAGKVAASDLTIDDGSALNIKAADGQGAISATSLTVGEDSSISAAGQAISVGGTTNGATKILGDVTAKSLTYAGTGDHIIAGDAVVNLDTLDFGTSTVQIGDDTAEANGSATVVVKNLTGTGTLFVDPKYGDDAALVIANNLSGTATPESNDAGTLQGSAIVGNNAALGIGFGSVAELKAVLGQFLDANGSFTENPSADKLELANALVLNKQITIDSNKGIVVQKGATKTTTVTGNSVTLADGTGLIVTDNVYSVQADGTKSGSAITFGANATVNGGGKVILSGNFDGKDDALQIFNAGTNTVTVSGTLSVQSANGLLKGEINDTNKGKVDLNVDETALKGAFTGVSAPVTQEHHPW